MTSPKNWQTSTQGVNETLTTPVNETLTLSREEEVEEKDCANAQTLPLDWQIATGQPIHLQDEKQAQMQDSANLIATGLPSAYDLALAFMQARDIVIPFEKAKGNRKAAREMLQMGVRPEHVRQATEQLIEKQMTIIDLFGVSKTAINLANLPPAVEEEDLYPTL